MLIVNSNHQSSGLQNGSQFGHPLLELSPHDVLMLFTAFGYFRHHT
jgi:hypothetical protein